MYMVILKEVFGQTWEDVVRKITCYHEELASAKVCAETTACWTAKFHCDDWLTPIPNARWTKSQNGDLFMIFMKDAMPERSE